MECEKEVWKSLLQYFMFQPLLEVTDVENILLELNDRRSSEVQLSTVIKDINAHIKRYGQQLTNQTCEVTEKEFMILVSTSNSPVLQNLSGCYTKEQREVYKRILAEIMMSQTVGCISSTHVLNLAHDLPFQITKSHLQETIDHMVNHGWFCKQDGKIYIGVRSIIEMAPYISKVYKDCLSKCNLCKNYVFMGIFCECGVVFHKHCVRKMQRMMDGSYECPNCELQVEI